MGASQVFFITANTYHVSDCISVYSPLGASISPLFITIILTSMLVFLVLFASLYRDSLATVRKTPSWACGFKYSPRMQMTAAPFTGALRTAMNWLYRSEVHFEETNGYFGSIKYSSHARDVWWDICYEPVVKLVSFLSRKASFIQNGCMQFYASYVFIALAIFLIIAFLL